MVDGLADLAEEAVDVAVEVADLVGDVVDSNPKHKRWRGCLILLALIAATGVLYMLLAD